MQRGIGGIAVIVIVAVIVIAGWLLYSAFNPDSALNNAGEGQLVGGDRDEHGCIGSAGYSWCEAKNSCIRVWEEYCTAFEPKTAVFNCADSKVITATFYPEDDKFVDLKLSDGRVMSVPRAISASGARYAKEDESFVFWNKGDTAFVTEGPSSTPTFSGCALQN